MRNDVFSTVGAQNMDTNGYQKSDQVNFKFYLENHQLNVDTVFRPGIDTHCSPTAFDDLEMRGSEKNPNLFDKE